MKRRNNTTATIERGTMVRSAVNEDRVGEVMSFADGRRLVAVRWVGSERSFLMRADLVRPM